MAIFTFNNPSGSSYFTLETVTTSSFYDASSLKSTLGVYSNFVNLSRDGLVTSSYISSVVVPNGTGSFTFDPTFSVFGTSSVYIRGTGEFTAIVSTYSGSFTLTPVQMYGAGILNTFALTPIPAFQARVAADSGSYEAFECQNNVFANTPVNILQTASLLLTPNAGKTSKLYSILPENGNGDFTVTRATTATRVNSAGLVELVPYNLVQFSQLFTNGIWTNNGSITTANQSGYDGTLNAMLLTKNASNGYLRQTSLPNSGTYTASVYAKADSVNFIAIATDFGTRIGYFDLVNGITGTATNLISSSITSVGNGWYRCSIVAIALSDIRFYPASINGSTVSTTGSIFIQNSQVVEGTSALTYQPTTTRLNIPRLDYSLGSCPNLLLEPQRTNLLTWSDDFSNVVWAKDRVTVSANAIVSPNGTTTADKVVDTLNGSTTYRIYNSTTLSAITYTQTFYAKAAEYNWCYVRIGNSLRAWFNIGTGVVGTVDPGLIASIESVGNGWYRIVTTITTATAGSGFGLIGLATDNGVETYTPTTGGMGIYVWGAQLEAGAYATSYIPTTSASVTRNADIVVNASATSIINSQQGTFYVNCKALFNGGSSRGISLSNGTYSNRIAIVQSPTTNTLLVVLVIGNTFIVNQSISGYTQTNFNKVAISWGSGNFKIFINGTLSNSFTGLTMPTANLFTRIAFDAGASFSEFEGQSNQMALFPTPLTDTQCTQLTTL